MKLIPVDKGQNYPALAGALASILVGLVGLALGGVALVKVDTLSRRVDQLSQQLTGTTNAAADLDRKVPANLPDRLSSVESASDRANDNVAKLQISVQSAFDQIGPAITSLQQSVSKLEEEAAGARLAAAEAAAKKKAEAVRAGEYIVKPGDTGMKISRATGASISQLEAANPDINWRRLYPGEIIKTQADDGTGK